MRSSLPAFLSGVLLSLSLGGPAAQAQTPTSTITSPGASPQVPSSSSSQPGAQTGAQQGTQPGSSSSNPDAPERTDSQDQAGPAARPRVAQIDPGGSAVTLETNEPLFDMAVALNVCGYDQGLDDSSPVRAKIRAELNKALEESEEARNSRDALCEYIQQHRQNDSGLNVGQYVSLALYLSPPPELTPSADETQLPPQAAAVINVLPKLRQFAQDINLHLFWIRHRAEYEALVARVHDPMAQMVLNTNIYLHLPVSTYDGRRFLVLLEPMLAPAVTNARIYGTDYIVQMSPDNTSGDPVRMDEIRHIYLHYIIEPLVYSRGTAMERIQPILRGVQDAPLEFFYKSDAPALLTECLIKAVEAHLFQSGPPPVKPRTIRERSDLDVYEAQKTAWDRANDLARLKLIDTDEAQGWVLTGFFYTELTRMSHDGSPLPEQMAPMIYGMDVQRELHHAGQVLFVKTVPPDPLRPAPRQPRQLTAMDRAEILLMQGKLDDAADLADKTMADPKSDHAQAQYILARVDLMQGDPEKALEGFQHTLELSRASSAPDPRTMAWSHIYMGRLYDAAINPPERAKAVSEYKAALAVRDSRPDTRAAAESGIARPYKLPQRANVKPADDDKDFDPTGKKEKESYRPDEPQQTTPPPAATTPH